MSGPQLLQKYLKNHGESQRSLERRIGAPTGYVCHWLGGHRIPSGQWPFAIEDATDGEVPARVWWEHAIPNTRG